MEKVFGVMIKEASATGEPFLSRVNMGLMILGDLSTISRNVGKVINLEGFGVWGFGDVDRSGNR